MDDASRSQLSRVIKARYAQPGEVLLRKRDVPREVCFIASGAVEVETAGQRHKLGRGDMFGQLSLLSRQTLRTQVIAISHTTLLVLDEARLRRLLDRNQALRAAVMESAVKRRIPTDNLMISD